MFPITSSFVLIIPYPFSQPGETRAFYPLLKDNTTKQLFPPISKSPTLSLLTTHEKAHTQEQQRRNLRPKKSERTFRDQKKCEPGEGIVNKELAAKVAGLGSQA